MSIYYPGCATPPNPTCSNCPPKELARVRGFWLQNVNKTFADISNPGEWDSAICSGQIYLFPYSNGTADQAEQLSDSYGNVPQQLDSYEYTLNLHEPEYANNIPFWNAIKNSNQWMVGYKTQTLIHLSSVAAMFFPKAPVSADIKAKIDINLMIKFIQSDLIVPQLAPVGIFNECIAC